MPVRSIFNTQFIGHIVGTPRLVQATDAKTGALTTKLSYAAPRIEPLGMLQGGVIMALTGSSAVSSGPQCKGGV